MRYDEPSRFNLRATVSECKLQCAGREGRAPLASGQLMRLAHALRMRCLPLMMPLSLPLYLRAVGGGILDALVRHLPLLRQLLRTQLHLGRAGGVNGQALQRRGRGGGRGGGREARVKSYRPPLLLPLPSPLLLQNKDALLLPPQVHWHVCL